MLDSDGEEGQQQAWPFELKCSPFVGLPGGPAGAGDNATCSSNDVSTGGMRVLSFDVRRPPRRGRRLQCVPLARHAPAASDPAEGGSRRRIAIAHPPAASPLSPQDDADLLGSSADPASEFQTAARAISTLARSEAMMLESNLHRCGGGAAAATSNRGAGAQQLTRPPPSLPGPRRHQGLSGVSGQGAGVADSPSVKGSLQVGGGQKGGRARPPRQRGAT
jgi:hypothetical protein